MKVYVATLYSQMPRAKLAHDLLINDGHEPTSRWVNKGEEGLLLHDAAQMDLDDIDRADAVLSLNLRFGSMYSGGGRMVEFGYAIAKGKRLLVVGDRETVFHNLPQVEVFATMAEAVGALSCQQ